MWFLLILQIIGIILGGTAALILFLAALSLFAPIEYEIKAEKEAVGNPALKAFRISWLFGCLRIVYDGIKLKITVFWFFLLKSKKKKRRRKKAKSKKKKSEKPVAEKPARSPMSRIKEILCFPNKTLLWKHFIRLIKRLLRALKPRKFILTAEIGLDDPAETGLLLGFLGIISGIWGIPMAIVGNFNEKTLKFNLYAEDRFMPWSFFWPLAVFCIKKPVRSIIKKFIFKKDDENEPDSESKL